MSEISIHALREEGDIREMQAAGAPRHELHYEHRDAARAGCQISVHARREEGDTGYILQQVGIYAFLSTPSARRATPFTIAMRTGEKSFLSTPSARRATFYKFSTEK